MENKDIIAVVGGEEITNAEFEKFLLTIPKDQRAYAVDPQYRESFMDQFISLRVFAKWAEDLKMEETEEYKKLIAEARREILTQMAVNSVLKDVVVEEEELTNFYEENIQHFQNGPTVSAKHILVADEETCLNVFAEINSGEKTFEEAAKEYSTCPSGAQGGDLGEFGKGQMVREFEEAAFEGEIGAVLGPVKTQFGYHLIKVEKKNEGSETPFEEVRDRIYNMILPQKQNRKYSEKYAELKEEYVK